MARELESQVEPGRAWETARDVGALLAERNERFEVLAIGGGGLLLLGISRRATADLDIAARKKGHGPSFLFEMGLPHGWEARTTRKEFRALVIEILGREDIVKLKLWAATDARAPGRRPRDVGDVKQLAPTRDELVDALRWCVAKDGTDSFVTSSGILRIIRDLGFEIDPSEGAGG